MESKLTTKQQEIIDFVIQKFNELNAESINKPFNVIDINLLNADINAVDLAKKELSIFNETMKKVHNEMVADFVIKMNKDFETANFPIIAKYVDITDGAHINIAYSGEVGFGSAISPMKIDMITSRHNEEVKYGQYQIGYKIIRFEYRKGYDSNSPFTTSPEAFFASEPIKQLLVKLIRNSISVRDNGHILSN